ncbi:hypothetical protein KKG71_00310 [Patescibacteria group bacterium]|nr:hypothetical protein [Patescibacteria group bacterium]
MKTKIINLKHFRQNITSLWKESQKHNLRFIVMFHSTPILEVLPFKDTVLQFDEETEFWQEKRKHKKIKKPENNEKNSDPQKPIIIKTLDDEESVEETGFFAM